jgi:hypothetical protein
MMRKTLVVLLILLSVFSISIAEIPKDDVPNLTTLSEKQSVVFSAELNISNGNPYTRDFGERGMFGKLVTGETVAKNIDEYMGDADRIFAEAKRLMVGPWENDGSTELSFYKVNGGKQLDLDTGKWVKSKGGDAIRLRHTSEYMGKIRYAYILTDSLTLWRRGD